MAYVYLFDLYKHIEKRLGDAGAELNKTNVDVQTEKFQQGRIDALTEIQDFLAEQFNPKLPRRIRNACLGKNSDN